MISKRNIRLAVSIFAALTLALFLQSICLSGSLEPSDLPGPTMKTLDEIPPTWHQILPADDGGPDGCDSSRFKCAMNGEAVLDKETGLVWERNPLINDNFWYTSYFGCYARSIGGRSGWRLPTVRELASLVDRTVPPPGPTLPSGHPFKNVRSAWYWTSSINSDYPDSIWGVDMSDGYASNDYKSAIHVQWCVRGGTGAEPEPTNPACPACPPVSMNEIPPTWSKKLPTSDRFVTVLDGWGVLDRETGLVWQKTLTINTYDWWNALSNCTTLNSGDRKGWRLPTVQELASLVDPSQSWPTLPSGHPFVNVQSRYYWSGTTDVTDPNRAWGVNMNLGAISDGAKTDGNTVWCVRGGQGVDPQ